MLLRRDIPTSIIVHFSWEHVLRFFAWGSAVYILHRLTGWVNVIPFLPVATIGTAVAFYIGFKNHASYERLWEARKTWGGIATDCRAWTLLLLAYMQPGSCLQTNPKIIPEMVNRQLAWINALRVSLRARPVFAEVDRKDVELIGKLHGPNTETMESCLSQFLPPEEVASLSSCATVTTAILQAQLQRLMSLQREGVRDAGQRSDLQKVVLACLERQSAAERIKTFPFPRQYAYFSIVFIRIFVFLLPFGLLGELAKVNEQLTWLIIPFTVLISWVFYTMEGIADSSENPFEGGLNDIPMTAMCREIEIELKSLIGETDLPQMIAARQHILL